MTHTVTIGGISFGEVFEIGIVKELNQIWSCELEVYDLTAGQEAVLLKGAYVEVNDGTKVVFEGLVRTIRTGVDGDTKTVKCQSEAMILSDRVNNDPSSTDGRKEWTSTAGQTIIADLISGIITAGTIDTMVNIGFRAEYDTPLGAVSGVAKVCGKDWWVARDAGVPKLNISTLGSQTSVQTFTMGVDAIFDEPEDSVDEIFNNIYVLGYGDGINQLRGQGFHATLKRTELSLTITDSATSATVSDASDFSVDDYIWIGREKCKISAIATNTLTITRGEDGGLDPYPHESGIEVVSAMYTIDSPEIGSSIQVNGLKENRYTERSIIDQNTIDFLAQRLVAKYKDESVCGEFEYLNDTMTADVGDVITIKDYDGNGVTRRIIRWEYNHQYGTILIKYSSVGLYTGQLVDLAKDLDVNNPYGQGATNIFQIQSYENCDDSYPLHVRFRIPDDVIAINKVLLSFKKKAYRLYSTQVASDGDHNHQASISMVNRNHTDVGTNKIYLVGCMDLAFDTLMTGHTSNMSKSVSNAVSDVSHTHPITLGIKEDTGYSSSDSVTVKAGEDGTTLTAISGSPFTSDQVDIDIVSLVGEPGKWYDVEFTPAAGKLMRIEANIYVKCFVRSK